MSTPSLRGLAKAYSDNLIDRKQYIRERRQLIDAITTGEAEIVPYAPPQKSKAELERTFSDGDTTIEILGVEQTAKLQIETGGGHGRWILAAIVVAIVAGAVLWLKPWEQTPAPIAEQTSVETQQVVAPISDTEKLLIDFLDANQWQATNIEEFRRAWSDVDESERLALADGPTLRRATDVLYQKVLEENALIDLGESVDAMETQRRLLDLAGALHISNERFDRLEADWKNLQAQVEREQSIGDTANAAALSTASSNLADSETSAAAGGDTVATAVDDAAALTSIEPNDTELVAAPAVPEADASDEMINEDPNDGAENEPVANEPESETTASNTDEDAIGVAENDQTTSTDAAAGMLSESSIAAVDTTPDPVASAASSKPTTRGGCRAELAKQRRPYCRDSMAEGQSGPPLAVLPAGTNTIGGERTEEQPNYSVTIEAPFAISVFEISYIEFQKFCQATGTACPAQPWQNPDYPVVNVSADMARAYTQWLSSVTGATYRLPSEAEWEYAAKGGTSTRYPFGDEVLPTHARFSYRTEQTEPLPSEDRSVNRNPFRLYHMLGNVREWVLDSWHDNHSGAPSNGTARTGGDSSYVAKGGSFADGPDGIRSASRMPVQAAGDRQTGFRVLCEIH